MTDHTTSSIAGLGRCQGGGMVPTITINGVQYHYVEQGHGPETIVFANRVLMHSGSFAAQLTHLSPNPARLSIRTRRDSTLYAAGRVPRGEPIPQHVDASLDQAVDYLLTRIGDLPLQEQHCQPMHLRPAGDRGGLDIHYA